MEGAGEIAWELAGELAGDWEEKPVAVACPAHCLTGVSLAGDGDKLTSAEGDWPSRIPMISSEPSFVMGGACGVWCVWCVVCGV